MATESGENQSDREIVLAAIQSGLGDREIVLAAVQQNWRALEFAAESCRGDREIVLAAVKQYGCMLEFAESCRGDREVVLAAVKDTAVQQDGFALQYAAESCRGDREVVLAAIEHVPKDLQVWVLKYASDELLEDSSFAADDKQSCRILKISMMSGRHAIVLSPWNLHARLSTEEVLEECCEKLGISSTGSMCLVSGDDVVPARTDVRDWPGIGVLGEISEYQLVV
eukprot:5784581-Amphidinium_carterae.1